MKVHLFDDSALLWFRGLPLTAMMLTTLATNLALLVVAWWVARAVCRHPRGLLAAAGRLGLGFLRSLVRDAAGAPWEALEIFGGSLFLHIAASALLGQLPGIEAPTANLAAASALAALVFLAVPVAGIRRRGLRAYLKHYLVPNPLLLPLHLVSELSRTLALSLRLFGNMMSGHLVVALLVALVGLLVPVPLMALDLLIGLLQAYIFTILACVYVGSAVRVGEEA